MARKFSSKERGAVLVELALLAPLLVTLVLGAIHFGYLFYLYNSLEKCVRDGARYAASRTFVSAASFSTAIRTVTAYGAVGSSTPIVPGLDPSKVTVTVLQYDVNGRPVRIRVAINGWQYNGVLSPFFGTVTLNGKPALEMPFLGLYLPAT
ncbi:MAG: TadE/TadG family type IV pilus assembly protein, partial [Bryobacteraceae bacterium]